MVDFYTFCRVIFAKINFFRDLHRYFANIAIFATPLIRSKPVIPNASQHWVILQATRALPRVPHVSASGGDAGEMMCWMIP